MYTVLKQKRRKKITVEKDFRELSGFYFGVHNRTYKINGQEVINLVIYNKKLAHPIVKEQVEKKYKKLMKILPDLLVSDDEDGEALKEALNEIERFRQIIKNKYRDYLNKKELELMGKQLSIIQKEAKNRMMEIVYSMERNMNRSTHR